MVVQMRAGGAKWPWMNLSKRERGEEAFVTDAAPLFLGETRIVRMERRTDGRTDGMGVPFLGLAELSIVFFHCAKIASLLFYRVTNLVG